MAASVFKKKPKQTNQPKTPLNYVVTVGSQLMAGLIQVQGCLDMCRKSYLQLRSVPPSRLIKAILSTAENQTFFSAPSVVDSLHFEVLPGAGNLCCTGDCHY